MSQPQDPFDPSIQPGSSEAAEPPVFGDRQFWDGFVHTVRQGSPAPIVNNGSRINAGLKVTADFMSLASSWREKVDPAELQNITCPKEKLSLANVLLRERQAHASNLLADRQFGEYFRHKWHNMSAKHRFAASTLTLAAWTLGIMIPEKPMTVEERERYRQMPVSEYVPMRIRHAFDPQNHITATLGMATIPNGVLKAMQGFKHSSSKKASLELVQGLMTVAAGSALSFIPDQEDAWQYSTLLFLGRTPFAGGHAYTAYTRGYPDKGIPAGDWQQSVQFLLNQSSNIFSFFYSGVKKLPDGTVIQLQDHGLEERAKTDPELAEALAIRNGRGVGGLPRLLQAEENRVFPSAPPAYKAGQPDKTITADDMQLEKLQQHAVRVRA